MEEEEVRKGKMGEGGKRERVNDMRRCRREEREREGAPERTGGGESLERIG